MRRMLLALIIALATPCAAAAQHDQDLFNLFTRCAELSIIIETLPEDAKDMGLTETELEVAVRSRLRAARIYDADAVYPPSPSLYLNVNYVGSAFHIKLMLSKRLNDPVSNLSGRAGTWFAGTTGVSRRADFIISSVSRLMDEFIDEYLSINEEACGR